MSLNTFTNVLAPLVTEGGAPDVLARRALLNGLVSALTRDEIRRLQKELAKITMRMDICSGLSMELLLEVSSYLDLEDIFTFRSVSRSWHQIFSSKDLCLALARLRFPSAWAQFAAERLPADPRSIGLVGKSAPETWFQRTAMEHLRRRHGRYHSMSVYYYNCEIPDPLPGQYYIERRYENGWVAFRLHDYELIARNLRTGQCTQFMDQNRLCIEEWYLTDQYIIAFTVRPDALCAWSLDNNEAVHTVRLFNRPLQVAGQGNQVGIIGNGGEVMVWNVGGSLRLVNTSSITKFITELLPPRIHVIFSSQGQTMFVAYQNICREPLPSGEYPLRLVVQELDRESNILATYMTDILSPNFPAPVLKPMLAGDSIVWTLEPKGDFTMASQTHEPRVTPGHILLVAFDFWTKAFTFQHYYLPTSLEAGHRFVIRKALVWNNQVILPVFKAQGSPESQPADVDDMLLLAVNSSSENAANYRKVPWYGKGGVGDRSIAFTTQDERFPTSDVAWCSIGGSAFARKASDCLYKETPWSSLVHLHGDDNFLVLFGRDFGMIVWCFDRAVELPISWSDLDPAVPEHLKRRHPFESL